MTDVRIGGLGREALVDAIGEARLGGMAREALISGASTSTHLRFAGMARETLLPASPMAAMARQYAVTVVT